MRLFPSAILATTFTWGAACVAQPVSGTPEQNSSATLWAVYGSEIADFIVGKDTNSDGFQILPLLEPLSTSSDDKGRFSRISQWCEPIPAVIPTYRRSGIMLSDIYGNYLKSLKYPDVPLSKRAEIEKLRKEYLTSSSEANRLAIQRAKAWSSFKQAESDLPPDRQTSYDVWNAREWGLKVGGAEAAVPVKASAYAYALTAAFGGYQDQTEALNLYENVAYKVKVKDQSGLETDMRTCSLGGADALTSFVTSGEQNVTAGKFAFSSSLATDKGHRTVTKWKVSARGGWGPFSAKGGGSRIDIHEDQQKFSMAVNFRNLATVGIDRSPWYKANIVALVNTPDRFVSDAIATPTKLWGANGVWSWTPNTLIIGYKPSIGMAFSQRDYDYFLATWNAGGGFSVGAFSIGGKGSGSTESTTWNEQNRTLTVEYNTSDIYVVGVINSFMPKSTVSP